MVSQYRLTTYFKDLIGFIIINVKPEKRKNLINMKNTLYFAMSEIEYTLAPTTKKPTRKYRKGSRYDTVLEAIKKSTDAMGIITIPNKEANYIRTQLQKRINALNVKNLKLSVVNNKCYYEKIAPTEKVIPEKVEPPKTTKPTK